jgi:hypothetical protein
MTQCHRAGLQGKESTGQAGRALRASRAPHRKSQWGLWDMTLAASAAFTC